MRTQCLECKHLVCEEGKARCTEGKPINGDNSYCADQLGNEGRDPSMEGRKVCSRCGNVVPLDEFYRNPRYSDGLDVYCKWCRKELNMRYQR